MLNKVENIKFKLNGALELNEETLTEINSYYKEFKERNQSVYNEKILVATNINNINNEFEIKVKDTLFSSVLFSRYSKK